MSVCTFCIKITHDITLVIVVAKSGAFDGIASIVWVIILTSTAKAIATALL